MQSLAEMRRTLREADLSGLPTVRIRVLRNVTVEPLEPILQYVAYRAGFRAEVSFSAFAGAYQEAAGESLGAFDVVLVWMHLDTLNPRLAQSFPELAPEEATEEGRRSIDELAAILRGVRAQSDAVLLCVGFASPPYPSLGIADEQIEHGQLGMVRGLNQTLREIVRGTRDAYFVDLDLALARIGAKQFFDARYWHIGRAPFSSDALREVASSVTAILAALRGRQRKCLVLDCDNVLWGGVAAEEGLQGISLGTQYPGSAFREFQQEVKNLTARGVIVCLCSKNEPDVVWEVFRSHPGMVLRETDIAGHRINWKDKAANIRELAEELNIGLESVVFMDDSTFEIERVKSALPEVATVLLSPDRAVEHRNTLLAGRWFDHPKLTSEDRRRTELYREEAARRRMREQLPDVSEYLRSLEMIAEVRLAGSAEIDRVAQLTQRTNQFNLSGRRYSADEVAALASAGRKSAVLALHLSDRFGDAGIVGAAVLRVDGEIAHVDGLVMSCRVLGRGAEDVLAGACVAIARVFGCMQVESIYVRTARNGIAADFWDRLGFESIAASDGAAHFRRSCRGELEIPTHFKRVTYPAFKGE